MPVELAPECEWGLVVYGRAFGLGCRPDETGPTPNGGWFVRWKEGHRSAEVTLDPDGFAMLELLDDPPGGAAWSLAQHVTPGDDGLGEALARVRDHVGERPSGVKVDGTQAILRVSVRPLGVAAHVTCPVGPPGLA